MKVTGVCRIKAKNEESEKMQYYIDDLPEKEIMSEEEYRRGCYKPAIDDLDYCGS